MTTPTLEERAGTLAEKIHGGSMTEIALFVAEHVYKERRAAQVEALEKAAEKCSARVAMLGHDAQGHLPSEAIRCSDAILALAERVRNGGTI